MKVKGREDDKREPHEKEPIEMTSDELLDYSLEPELADQVKRIAKPPEESTDSEQEC